MLLVKALHISCEVSPPQVTSEHEQHSKIRVYMRFSLSVVSLSVPEHQNARVVDINETFRL